MFSHRFKIEIRENKIYLILWALVLAILSVSAISYWNSDIKIDPRTGRPENGVSELIGLLIVPLVAIPIVSTITSFRLDNLKDPRAFWNTRPIRPNILHTTKFVFLHLAYTIPVAICTFIIGVNATSAGSAMIFSAEAALWCAAAIHLSALSALHNHQWSKLLLIPALGLIGIMITAFIANHFDLIGPTNYDPARSVTNLLVTIFLLLIVFIIACGALIKKPRIKFPLWAPFLLGSLVVPLLSATWLPRFKLAGESVEFKPSEPITAFATASTRYNHQHFYLLNYHLDGILPDSDRTPVNLLTQRVDQPSEVDFQTELKSEIRSWQSNANELPGKLNLQSLVMNQHQDRSFKLSLSIGIPHDHSVQGTPDFTDIPRKNVTFEGEFRVATVAIDDAYTIKPGTKIQSVDAGRSLTYIPATKKGQQDAIVYRSFSLPLASSELVGQGQRYFHRSPILFMRHRETGQYFTIDEGSSSGRGGVFGSTRYSEIRNVEENHLVNYQWKNNLQKNIPDLPDFEEWKKNADLKILPPETFEYITIPFKITVSLPDPDLVQKKLNEMPER